ncbi:DgyrCDS6855 [Dimorphilus gyrociliatus]|uniref:DgyrCDS6855 n=1 Tax=Dimorphilus gyrociliatus TaxID=2664684 RepID=A0A7I8VRJ0_9ANNE|nr:DgyrCDS6855 [Dimorphilus gyrociliatus]
MAEVETNQQNEETSQNTYIIRPSYQSKFRSAAVKETIHQVLKEHLKEKIYSAEDSMMWTRDISEDIKAKVKDLGYERYKLLVQVVIGELRGEGVKMACRCFWDSDTDNYAQDVFMNVK